MPCLSKSCVWAQVQIVESIFFQAIITVGSGACCNYLRFDWARIFFNSAKAPKSCSVNGACNCSCLRQNEIGFPRQETLNANNCLIDDIPTEFFRVVLASHWHENFPSQISDINLATCQKCFNFSLSKGKKTCKILCNNNKTSLICLCP